MVYLIKMVNLDNSTFSQLKTYYDETLNMDKSTYVSSNDEPTPINCIVEMIAKIPQELFKRDNLSILDPCCGNGNFGMVLFHELLNYHDKNKI